MTCLTFCCHSWTGISSFNAGFLQFLSEALNWTRKTGYRKSEKQNPGPSQKMHETPEGLKLFTNGKGVFWSLFSVNNFFKMITVFAIFASENSKQLLSRLYVAIFPFYAKKMRKMPQGYRGCGSRRIMRIRTTASCQMLCFSNCGDKS